MYTHRLPTTLLLTVVLALPFTLDVAAQTPTTTVKDASDNTVFQTFAQGQLLAPGPFNAGAAIPASGSGTRLMWWPEKAAFRAGRVFDNSGNGGADGDKFWNTTNVGNSSIALGLNTKASGNQATAMGQNTIASGPSATAMGFGTIAANKNSVTVGLCNDRNSTSGGTALFVVGNGGDRSGKCGRGTPEEAISDAFVIENDGSAIASSHNTFSDRRLKTSVEPLAGDILAKLAKLRPVRYTFKNQETHPSGEQIGLIAQDVRTEFPQLVSKGTGGTLLLAYPKLTAVLLKGLQEQQSTIESQNAQLEKQQAQIDSLERRVQQIDDVKKRLAALEADDHSAPAGWIGGGPFRALGLLLIGGVLGAGLLAVRQ